MCNVSLSLVFYFILFSILHGFVVDLLLHSTDHLLLVNTLGTGVNAIDRMTASAIRYY